jgi:NADPH2:quinone reductase
MAVQVVAPAHADRGVIAVREAELAAPRNDEVAISVRAVGVNPTDWKSADATWPRDGPLLLGFEASGVVTGLGPHAGGRGLRIGDAVIAYPVLGAYASDLLVPAGDLLLKPPTLGFPEAANLLLVGATAAEMLHVCDIGPRDTVLVHGASGATGVSAVQQIRRLGARVVATSGEGSFALLRSLGATPVAYGPGLADRLRAIAPSGFTAALDCVGTDEAMRTSRDMVPDHRRIVSIVNRDAPAEFGIAFIDGRDPASYAFRNVAVPVARTFPLAAAGEALQILRTGHPGGKLALIP